MSSDSIVGFKHRLANYFERISGDISHLKQIFDTLPKAYLTPESQDTLMRFIADRCGFEEAEAAEELDYVTARLERERRNERFERLLEPWTTEQLEASLRQFFANYDPSQLSTVSALVTFHRGREISLIRELELQYRKPVLLQRDDEEAREEEAGSMDLAHAAALMSHGGGDDDDDDDDDDDGEGQGGARTARGGGGDGDDGASGPNGIGGNNSRGSGGNKKDLSRGDSRQGRLGGDGKQGSGGEMKKLLGSGGGGIAATTSSMSGNSGSSGGGDDGKKKQPAGGDALRIKTNWDEITVDSMQLFEMDILRFLLEIRQELQERVAESELLAQQYALVNATSASGTTNGGDSENNNNNNVDGESNNNNNAAVASSSSITRRRAMRKSSTIRRVIAASQLAQQEEQQLQQQQGSPSKNKNDAKNKNSKDDKNSVSSPTNNANPATSVTSQDVENSVNELSRELAALPRKRLGRVERMMQVIPLIARAVTPIFKSQLLLYLGFYCSLRVEARKVMQKRIVGNLHDAPLKADENFQRRSAAILSVEKDSRNDILAQERRNWARMDPLFYRERFLRLVGMLVDEEQMEREEVSFDEMCISSVARAKVRSLLFIERSFVDLNFLS